MSMVLLQNGKWVSRAALEVGHILASPDGRCSYVLSVGPLATEAAMTIKFRDGREITVGKSQAWKIHCDRWAHGQKNLDTGEVVAAAGVSRNAGRLGTPLVDGDFGSGDLPLSAWMLGALLGDGCFRGSGPTFTTEDDEIRRRMLRHVTKHGATLSFRGKLGWGIRAGYDTNRITAALKHLDLWGRTSLEKHVPQAYLEAPRSDRHALLQGLMDTDGTAGKDGSVQYASSSAIMAAQVQSLVWSLGGVCSRRVKRTTHADAYILGIRLREPASAFTLSRKRMRLAKPNRNAQGLRPKILSASEAGGIVSRQFRTSHPEGLFVGDNFVVLLDDRPL